MTPRRPRGCSGTSPSTAAIPTQGPERLPDHPGAANGAHHHGDQETILYVVEGITRYRWGQRLEHAVEAGPGDFVSIPAHTVHQEINASADSPTVWAVTRLGTDPIVVNLPELDKFAEPTAREYPHA